MRADHSKNKSLFLKIRDFQSHKWTFRLAEDSWRSHHRLQNDTDVFVEIQPLRRNFELTDRWILHDLESNKFFKYRYVRKYVFLLSKIGSYFFSRAISRMFLNNFFIVLWKWMELMNGILWNWDGSKLDLKGIS